MDLPTKTKTFKVKCLESVKYVKFAASGTEKKTAMKESSNKQNRLWKLMLIDFLSSTGMGMFIQFYTN